MKAAVSPGSEEAMKYICLVYHEEGKLEALPTGELDALVAGSIAWAEELEKSGHHVFSAGLQSVRTAMTVRSRNGSLSMTDGPFAETKEQLGGFTIFSARDLNEALRLASRLPAARLGSVEVRPVLGQGEELTGSLDQKLGAAIRRNTRELSCL
jgi:hypothetical protein